MVCCSAMRCIGLGLRCYTRRYCMRCCCAKSAPLASIHPHLWLVHGQGHHPCPLHNPASHRGWAKAHDVRVCAAALGAKFLPSLPPKSGRTIVRNSSAFFPVPWSSPLRIASFGAEATAALPSPPPPHSTYTHTASRREAKLCSVMVHCIPSKTLGQPPPPRWVGRAGALCRVGRTCLVPSRGLGQLGE